MNRKLGRRSLALILAYALALTALLPGAALVWPSGADAGLQVICGPGGGSQTPADRPADPVPPEHPACPGGACTMAGCAWTAAPEPALDLPSALAWVDLGTLQPGPDRDPPIFRPPGDKLPRGPPIT